MAGTALAQSTTFIAGFMPEINILVPLSDRVKLRNTIESRAVFLNNGNEDDRWKYEYLLTDLSAIAAIKVGAAGSLNAGYLIRFLDGEVFHRFIQRYRFVTDIANLRLGHRAGIDQTFNADGFFEFRTRYRINLEKALNGQRIDPGEFYFKLGAEALWEVADGRSEIETRLTPILGFEIGPGHGLEGGLDYRVAVTLEDPIHALWITITYFRTLAFNK